jgi:hypothetical protein
VDDLNSTAAPARNNDKKKDCWKQRQGATSKSSYAITLYAVVTGWANFYKYRKLNVNLTF